MTDKLPEIKEGLVVRPGDTLVVAVEPEFTFDEYQRLQNLLPGVKVIMVAGATGLAAIPRENTSAREVL